MKQPQTLPIAEAAPLGIGFEDRLDSPQRIQLSRKNGWKMPPNTVKVSRPTKWGNPFKVTPERSQISAVGAFNTWLTVEGCDAGLGEKKKWILEHIHYLKGKNLACFCHANQACHADILLRLSNDRTELPPPDTTVASKKNVQ